MTELIPLNQLARTARNGAESTDRPTAKARFEHLADELEKWAGLQLVLKLEETIRIEDMATEPAESGDGDAGRSKRDGV